MTGAEKPPESYGPAGAGRHNEGRPMRATSNSAATTVPRRYRRIIARACARDREHFERHPGVTTYRRPAMPGEFYPQLRMPATMVTVRAHGHPDLRTRSCGEFVVVDTEGVFADLAPYFLPSTVNVSTEPGDESDVLDDRPHR